MLYLSTPKGYSAVDGKHKTYREDNFQDVESIIFSDVGEAKKRFGCLKSV